MSLDSGHPHRRRPTPVHRRTCGQLDRHPTGDPCPFMHHPHIPSRLPTHFHSSAHPHPRYVYFCSQYVCPEKLMDKSLSYCKSHTTGCRRHTTEGCCPSNAPALHTTHDTHGPDPFLLSDSTLSPSSASPPTSPPSLPLPPSCPLFENPT
ncbi:hypothetical protein B0H11DRAFT_1996224 [Mycena galericulata]|nr:hypothetical protein B0H11DRAFT_1996224 [Mycena galericulata]